MITVAEAMAHIYAHVKDFGTESIPFLEATNRVLAQDVVADRDFPPYHRVTMDGIAIHTPAFETGTRSFFIEGIQAAGAPLQALQKPTHCLEVMTGAVLPNGTNAVVPYEECNLKDGIATVQSSNIKPFQNIHLQGTDSEKGTVLIQKNTTLKPAHLGIMASVGLSTVLVYKHPAVAICATGDELVDVDETPLPHQIRKSNVYMLAAALQQEGISASLHHLPDDATRMQAQLGALLPQCDVVLLSGAVSKGKYDYLPEVLRALGMQTVFHRVAQRPGKPFLFGAFPGGKLVFGFPGNPVSTFVCFHIYYKPWQHRCLHRATKTITVRLARQVSFLPKLSYHLPATLEIKEGITYAHPIIGANSGDMPSLIYADAILTLPAEWDTFEEGVVVEATYC